MKVAINEAKHHITFSEASTVFADENAILFDHPNRSMRKKRFMMLGLNGSRKNVNSYVIVIAVWMMLFVLSPPEMQQE